MRVRQKPIARACRVEPVHGARGVGDCAGQVVNGFAWLRIMPGRMVTTIPLHTR
jgi:hypothetical protein